MRASGCFFTRNPIVGDEEIRHFGFSVKWLLQGVYVEIQMRPHF